MNRRTTVVMLRSRRTLEPGPGAAGRQALAVTLS
jgi:hypothetical protein